MFENNKRVPDETWSILDYALYYIGLGFAVLPKFAKAREGRIGFPKGGYRVASLDEEKALKWWKKNSIKLIAIRTGLMSNIVVLDIDRHPGQPNGFESLERLEADYGKLPKTVTARTGGGGRHYYFRLPDFETYIPSSAFNRIGYAGIDFIAEGKGVFAPPGIHKYNRGEYRYEPGLAPWETEFAVLPVWLLKLAQSIQDAKPRAVPADTDAQLFGVQSREEDTDTYTTGGKEKDYSLYVCDIDANTEKRIAGLRAKWLSTEFELGTSWDLVRYLISDLVCIGISEEASEKAVGAVIGDHLYRWRCRRPVTQFRNDVLNGHREVMKRNPQDFGRVTRRHVDIEIPEVRIERLKQLPRHQMLL